MSFGDFNSWLSVVKVLTEKLIKRLRINLIRVNYFNKKFVKLLTYLFLT